MHTHTSALIGSWISRDWTAGHCGGADFLLPRRKDGKTRLCRCENEVPPRVTLNGRFIVTFLRRWFRSVSCWPSEKLPIPLNPWGMSTTSAKTDCLQFTTQAYKPDERLAFLSARSWMQWFHKHSSSLRIFQTCDTLDCSHTQTYNISLKVLEQDW